MSLKLKALREQRATLAKEVRNLLEKTPGKEWKPENQADYDAKMVDIERLDAEMDRVQKVLDLDAENRIDDAVEQAMKGRKADPTSSENLYRTYLRGGIQAYTPDQAAAYRNTMSTTTNTEGGYTVPTSVAKQLIDSLKLFGGMRLVADVFYMASGNPMSYPTSDGTAETGEVIAENTDATAADLVFGTAALNVWKFSSKKVAVPIELIMDSVLDVEAVVNNRLRQRLGRIMNTKFTIGTGTAEPFGVSARASSGKVGTTGQTLTVIYDDLVDLEHAVDPLYRQGAKWMLADTSLKVVRKIKDTAGRPIFTPSYDAGISRGAPAQLSGYDIQVNQDVAVMAANAKSILFGDFSYYKIRDTLDVSLFRFADSAYISKGQIGFLAWARAGGNLVDTASVKYYQNSAS